MFLYECCCYCSCVHISWVQLLGDPPERRSPFVAGLELVESGPEVMYIERHQAKFTCVGCVADKKIARLARTAALGSLGRLLMSIDMRTGGVVEGALQCKSVL